MSGSVNTVILVGHLGADPEIRVTQAGKPIANMRLATSESWKDKSGQRQERTTWHTVVCFNEGLCKVIEKYLSKGSLIYVQGSLQTRKWEDQQGNTRYATEVVLQNFSHTLQMLDSPKGDGFRDERTPKQINDAGRQEPLDMELDDEVPW